MGKVLKTIGLFGLLSFASLFSVTFVSPEKVEESAKGFVTRQIEFEVRERHQDFAESRFSESASLIVENLAREKTQIYTDLDDQLPKKIAHIIGSMCGYDCEKKKHIEQLITSSYLGRLKSIEVAESTLSDVVKGKYVEIVGSLQFDLRVFLGVNSVMFFILLVISLLNPRAIRHLFIPGILLALATFVSSNIYIFGQDWFYTILYNNYMGFGYLVYVSIIFGFLIDITFNKAQVTSLVLSAIGTVIDSVFSC
ncbi:hypothetical protein [Alteromonas sp. KUL49]|uniref:hypothetical protein n=1 Tax=Alteromonas sp. KUL49 TaxID=2480798 RepID=UPI00102EDBCB|nr:hypothetical protein [Alteromonas sp. KUL49]TAP40800.1 hypothetical protein EYS00_06725 [Alteromonas sp. KUL49]GEA10976.1 hypothetical protein KUL49_13510 [Alteromonas sp. KUL49]